jgi:hypothetical protein
MVMLLLHLILGVVLVRVIVMLLLVGVLVLVMLGVVLVVLLLLLAEVLELVLVVMLGLVRLVLLATPLLLLLMVLHPAAAPLGLLVMLRAATKPAEAPEPASTTAMMMLCKRQGRRGENQTQSQCVASK